MLASTVSIHGVGVALMKLGTRSAPLAPEEMTQRSGNHVGRDIAGMNGVDPDALRGKLVGQCLGQTDQTLFGGPWIMG